MEIAHVRCDPKETSEWTAPDGISLANAQFTIKYFDTISYTKPADVESSSDAMRTWLFKTDANGRLRLTDNSNYFISGDDLYTFSDGSAELPIGSVVIEETKAPIGFKVNNDKFLLVITMNESGTMATLTVYDKNGERLDVRTLSVEQEADISIEVEEEQKYGRIAFRKEDAVTGTIPQGDAVFAGAQATVRNITGHAVIIKNDDGSFETIANGGTVKVLTLSGGSASLSGLPVGRYEITETKAPAGYNVNSSWKLTAVISDKGEDVLETEYSGNTILEDSVILGGMTIAKADEDGAALGDSSLAGIRFAIVNSSAKAVTVDGISYAPGSVVKVVTINENGTAATGANELPYGTYDVYELRKDASIAAGDNYSSSSGLGNSIYANERGYLFSPDAKTGVSISAVGQMETVSFTDEKAKGRISIRKEASDGMLNEGDASIAGIRFAIVNSSAKAVMVGGTSFAVGKVVRILTTDLNGNASTAERELPYGTYDIYELRSDATIGEGDTYINSPGLGSSIYANESGYLFNESSGKSGIAIRTDGQVQAVSFADEVVKGNIKGVKLDAETEDGSATEGFSLEGGQITLINASANKVLNGVSEIATAGDAIRKPVVYEMVKAAISSTPQAVYAVMTTDADGGFFAEDVPYGTYYMIETKAPEGYLINKDWVKKVEIREEGATYSYLNNDEGATDAALKNRPIRRDFEFLKISIDGISLPYTPFLISRLDSNGNVIEQHVFAADENGWFKSSGHDKTSQAVNSLDGYSADGSYMKEGALSDGNADDARAGIWFGNQSALSNERGSLVYGTYIITELKTKASTERSETVEMLHGTLEVNGDPDGEDADKALFFGVMVDLEVKIETDALDVSTGTRMTLAGKDVSVRETIRYDHLDTREQYRWVVKFVDGRTGASVGGSVIDKWSPDPTSASTYATGYDTVTVDAKIDTSGYSNTGGKIVGTVYLYQYVDGVKEPLLVADHADLADERETLYVPGISTKAVDSLTKDHVGTCSERDKIQDTVTVVNLAERSTYRLEASLYERNADGTETPFEAAKSVSKTFSAGRNMIAARDIKMPEIEFDGADASGKTLVVYEDLYWIDEPEDEIYVGCLIASHREILDEEQSVYYPEIRTNAYDGDTLTSVGWTSETAVICDNVEMDNLIPGTEYHLMGNVHYKEDVTDEKGNVIHKAGEVIKGAKLTKAVLNGEDLTLKNGKAGFTATDKHMEVELKYELDSSDLDGYSAVVFEDLYHNGVKTATHSDLEDRGQTVYYPKLATTGFDTAVNDGEKYLHTGRVKEEVIINDKVDYSNLLPDEEYTIIGHLAYAAPCTDAAGVQHAAGEILKDADGCMYEAELTLAAGSHKADGTACMEFAIDSSVLAGITVVAFENLYHNGVNVTAHADINDLGQQVHFPEIRTVLLDGKSGTKEAAADSDITFIDTVTYENLVPGETYIIKGMLYNKADGKAASDDNGNEIWSEEVEFTPEKETGSICVTFAFSGKKLCGAELAAFEYLYINDVLVRCHEEPDDEDQTARVTGPPEITENKNNMPATGDENHIIQWIGILLISMIAVMIGVYNRKKIQRALVRQKKK